jgi:DNA-binding LytR/AlgR family response regulator
MVSILIVEDEVLIAEFLKDTLISVGFQQIKLAHSKTEALEAIKAFEPGLVLLDIRMENDLDGISVAETISATNNIPFIFITAHSDKEILQKALATKPAAYLTKPFKKVDVFAAVSLAIQEQEYKTRKFIFKDGFTTIALACQDILYIESEGNYIYVVTNNRKYTIRHSLEWCLQHLPESQFKRIHRSFIVNTDKIEKSNAKSVFIPGRELPKSRNKFSMK